MSRTVTEELRGKQEFCFVFLIVSSRVWVIAVCLGLYNFVCLLCGRYGRTGGRTRMDGEKFRCGFFLGTKSPFENNYRKQI